MAIKPILKYNAPELRQVCPPFDWNNASHVDGLQDLHDTLADAQGGMALGLAANQIGLMARAFAFRLNGKIEIAVNPKVEQADTRMETEEESCLSFPNLKAKVMRPASGVVTYKISPSEGTVFQLTGWEFRCFLHELDHLNGITLDLIRRKKKA